MNSRRALAWELVLVTGSLVLVSHILYSLRTIAWIDTWLSTIVAFLFLYTPVMVLWKQGRGIDFLDRTGRAFFRSVLTFAIAATIVFPVFFLLAHGWQMLVIQSPPFRVAGFPDFLEQALFQTMMIALPEEFFFRGYFQSMIDRIFSQRWRLLGVDLGWGWVITSAVFAAAHSIVTYQWWHFSIFFPALLFGYLRARTGTITAPILFHAASNLFMHWFTHCYLGTVPTL